MKKHKDLNAISNGKRRANTVVNKIVELADDKEFLNMKYENTIIKVNKYLKLDADK